MEKYMRDILQPAGKNQMFLVKYWLVGGLQHFFHNIWNNPSHWFPYFSRWLKPPTSWPCLIVIGDAPFTLRCVDWICCPWNLFLGLSGAILRYCRSSIPWNSVVHHGLHFPVPTPSWFQVSTPCPKPDQIMKVSMVHQFTNWFWIASCSQLDVSHG